MKPYEVIKHEKLLKANIIDVIRDTITLPDGNTGLREVVLHGNATAIVPVDDEGNIIFVRQYRHAAKEEVLEIPAGMIEKEEDPLVCASRELEEETAYKAGTMTFLFSMYSSIGFCNEILFIYLAENLSEGKQHLDDDEFVQIEKYPLEAAIAMIYRNEIKDSKTIAAIFAYKDLLASRTS